MRVSDAVQHIMADREATRNSDKLLLLEIWAYYGLKLTPQQEDRFLDMPSAETVRRIRQKLQESGKYPPTKEVGKRRLIRSLEMQQRAPKATPKYIEQTLL